MTGAVIVAAGQGSRLGGSVPKAMRNLAGRPLYAHSLEAALGCPLVEEVVLVVPGDYCGSVAEQSQANPTSKTVRIVEGGDSRQQSVMRGLSALKESVEWVAVHDAARPLVTSALFREVIDLARKQGGALCAHPATDTIKRQEGGRPLITIPRSELWHAETPQVFRHSELKDCLEKCELAGIQVTDEAEAMERHGHSPALYHNTSPNPKISTAADWLWAESLFGQR
jgi:2-C-methyl-D-erythritol 4-phosphate cytidylyltransferase